jgi:hypothetical protein
MSWEVLAIWGITALAVMMFVRSERNRTFREMAAREKRYASIAAQRARTGKVYVAPTQTLNDADNRFLDLLAERS